MRLGERAPTALAAVAALSPAQPDRLAGDRQIAHSDHRALLDVEGAAPAARAACGSRHQLDLEVELVATLDEGLHLEAVQADEAANVALHPLFLLAPRFTIPQSLVRAADVSSYALNPGVSA